MRDTKQASIRFIVVSVLLDVLGIGLMLPVLPSLVGSMTQSREEQALWYGAIMLTFGFMQFVCAPILGALSDRFGRRPVLLLSIVGLGLNFLVTALAQSPWTLLLARVWGGATAASFSVASAYVADVTPDDKRAEGFGKIGAAFGVGFIVGPIAGGLLGEYSLRLPFFLAAGLSLANALYGAFVLPESLPLARRAPFSWRRATPHGAVMRLLANKSVRGLIVVLILVLLAQFVLQTSWVLSTTFRYGWTPRDNGISLFLVGLSSAIVQGGLQGRLLRRLGEKRLALFSLGSGGLAYLALGLATEGWMLYAIIAGNFLSSAAGPTMQAILSRSVGPTEQGTTMGAVNSLQSIMMMAGIAISAPIMAHIGTLERGDVRTGAAFFLCSLLQFVAVGLAFAYFRSRPLPPRSAPSEADA